MEPNIPINQVPKPTIKELSNKILSLAKEVFDKVYKNKKLFWLFTSLLIFMGILIIVGTIYRISIMGKSVTNADILKTTPKPIVINTDDKPRDDLSQYEDKLRQVEMKLKNYDPYQKRLNPPVLDFDIVF